jgi:pilus assembly protein CpaC
LSIALAVAVGVVVGCAALPSGALGQTPVTIERIGGTYAGQLVVSLNKSQVLETDVPYSRVAVGSSQIADVLPLTDRTIYVLGKTLGSTSLSIFGKDDAPLAVMDIVVTYDIQGLKGKLNELFPTEQVEIRPANESIVLSGTASSAERLSGVLAVAAQYAPGRVTNLMSVKGSQQVLLEVRFVEVQRNLTRNLGVNPELAVLAGDFVIALLNPIAIAETPASVLAVGFQRSDVVLDTVIDALEAKGAAKLLAKPNLIALSGDTARFLAGGEFPIPVAQEEGAITIEFKEFGVSLAFTPTVLSDDLINLVVNPEVSQLDFSTAVVTDLGFRVPGLTTRRATTTIELRDGQSFAIAGLLQDTLTSNVDQIPWLGDVPVLGGLFRSTSYLRRETELVIIVTVHLVKPAHLSQLASPDDYFVPPDDYELFFMGRVAGKRERPESESDQAEAAARQLIQATPDGGIAASYGHIIQ